MTIQQQADEILAKVGGPVICSWCLPKITVLKVGDPSKPISHGICQECKPKLEQEVA